MNEIFNELEIEDENFDIIFDEMFNNRYENKTYILTGDIGLWDGVRRGVHHPSFFNSMSEAILTANDGFNGYISVYEDNGKLIVHICHHDGNNYLEIRELNKLGEQMMNEYKSVGDIIRRKNASKKINYIKNYMR